jgi:hypothetical protein
VVTTANHKFVVRDGKESRREDIIQIQTRDVSSIWDLYENAKVSASGEEKKDTIAQKLLNYDPLPLAEEISYLSGWRQL